MEWDVYKIEFEKKSNEKIEWLENELSKIRTGKVSSSILDDIYVDYFGTKSKIIEVANIKSVDSRQLLIKPYDPSILNDINKAISKSNIGVNPVVDSDSLRLSFPPQTEENRKALVKKTKEYSEQAKIGVRNIRKDIHNKINKDTELTKDNLVYYVDSLDKIVKNKNTEIDKIIEKKEKELMTI
ncbi:MAG: ribosome recycling factor [Mycoplasmoidaceae bacterium]